MPTIILTTLVTILLVSLTLIAAPVLKLTLNMEGVLNVHYFMNCSLFMIPNDFVTAHFLQLNFKMVRDCTSLSDILTSSHVTGSLDSHQCQVLTADF